MPFLCGPVYKRAENPYGQSPIAPKVASNNAI
jgi:hypothetical protein